MLQCNEEFCVIMSATITSTNGHSKTGEKNTRGIRKKHRLTVRAVAKCERRIADGLIINLLVDRIYIIISLW